MELEINVPDYLSITNWKFFNSLEHLSDSEKMITLIAHLTEKPVDEIKKYKPVELQAVYKTLLAGFQDLTPQFYPIFELDDVLYGFRSITSMTTGEYIDLERLAKNPVDNLEEIMAILYRPITKQRFSGIKWAFKNTYKVALGEAENLFKYYEVEEYDNSVREENAAILSNIPASVGLGALSFFLVLATSFSVSSNLSSLPPQIAMKEMKAIQMQMDSLNIGHGLQHFIIYLQLPSYQSEEKEASWTAISSSYLTSSLTNKIKQSAMSNLGKTKNELIKELDNG